MLLHDESPVAVESREAASILGTYRRASFHPRYGKGARLFDAEGKGYWDLLSGIGVNVLGHQHPALLRALRKESRNLLHVSNLYFHPAQSLLAERLLHRSHLSAVFFCNSGTEANEAAIKFARLKNPGRPGIVALEGSFHGRSAGSLSVTGTTGYRQPFEPLLGGVTFVPPNDIGALRTAITSVTGAIILEPVLGEGGVVPLTIEFLQAAEAAASENGTVLICDEIQSGLGRTGTFFAFERAGIAPDMVTLAKPLGGGLPLGAVLAGSQIASVVRPGHHGTTFGGNPLACRLGIAVLDEIEQKGLLERVQEIGAWLGTELESLTGTSSILAIRGSGLMWGIELDRPAQPVAAALLERGFVVGTARENVLRLLPPYIVPKQALRHFLTALEGVLGRTASGRGGRASGAIAPGPPARGRAEIQPLSKAASESVTSLPGGGGTPPGSHETRDPHSEILEGGSSH
ncbi:MAG TPA: acetylornithine/succinylornithine family transaminase [Thermoanaerobaculia bacterium]|nr:acetylornithine/succinylornithine family transaminase [Thermoanaerobaculia bacterium]